MKGFELRKGKKKQCLTQNNLKVRTFSSTMQSALHLARLVLVVTAVAGTLASEHLHHGPEVVLVRAVVTDGTMTGTRGGCGAGDGFEEVGTQQGLVVVHDNDGPSGESERLDVGVDGRHGSGVDVRARRVGVGEVELL